MTAGRQRDEQARHGQGVQRPSRPAHRPAQRARQVRRRAVGRDGGGHQGDPERIVETVQPGVDDPAHTLRHGWRRHRVAERAYVRHGVPGVAVDEGDQLSYQPGRPPGAAQQPT
ncbi:hypothetical protein AB0M35_11020 [Micromonospora sp. NPDC051196]|uniref:hypothetical protein n=1 Tax=Micromonospora sp. NPDC051196 TaxID=3155281 RepID=UPI0034379EE8